jgi:LmbE family N-acetylglucosaminyl deacetylase
MPVLIGLSRMYKPRRILEFGAGQYSTPLFLNREVFSEVELLHSLENGSTWKPRLEELAAGDSRLKLSFTDAPLDKLVPGLNFADYDLVFVDDNPRSHQAVADHCVPSNVIIIHDYNEVQYHPDHSPCDHLYESQAMWPSTAIFWNQGWISQKRLENMDWRIRHHAGETAIDDWVKWLMFMLTV